MFGICCSKKKIHQFDQKIKSTGNITLRENSYHIKTLCTYEYSLLANGVGATHDKSVGVSLELPLYQVNSEVNHLTLGREGICWITVSKEKHQRLPVIAVNVLYLIVCSNKHF